MTGIFKRRMNTSVHHPNDGVVTREFYTALPAVYEDEIRLVFETAGFQNIKFSERSQYGVKVEYDGPTMMNKEQREFILKFNS